MARLVCLANSFKMNERCIAGKATDTGQWLRPVSALEHGEITWDQRAVDRREPQLLDVLEIPLQDHGPDYGCQPENRLLAAGRWEKVATVSPRDALGYLDADAENVLFYNYVDRVRLSTFRRIPRSRWKSLRLIRCSGVDFHPDARRPHEWRATFEFNEAEYADLKVTDPVAEARLNRGEPLAGPCLLTISLGMPFRPAGTTDYCFKLVAAVIPLDESP